MVYFKPLYPFENLDFDYGFAWYRLPSFISYLPFLIPVLY